MSSSRLASTSVGLVSVVGPARSTSSRQDHRADPISRLSLSESSHASLPGEADNVAKILGHAARLTRLDPASFPTFCNASATTFPHSQLAIAPLLAQLIAMVDDLGTSVTFLISQVENLTSAQAGRSATPSPPAISNLQASLKDLSSRVAALSSHHATQVVPQPAQAASPLLSRKRSLLPACHLVPSPPQTSPFLSRENGMATRRRTLNATETLPKLLLSLPLATPSQRKPNSTPSAT